MKNLKLIHTLIVFFIFNISISNAENIAFIDMNAIINNSAVGIKISKSLEASHKKNILEFKKIEESLKKKEIEIISKKNILDKDKYEKEIKLLREKVKIYRKEREDSLNNLSKKRINATKELIRLIDPIIQKYSSDNSVSLILNKKNIILGLI